MGSPKMLTSYVLKETIDTTFFGRGPKKHCKSTTFFEPRGIWGEEMVSAGPVILEQYITPKNMGANRYFFGKHHYKRERERYIYIYIIDITNKRNGH